MNKILKCLLSVFMVISLAFSSLAALVALSPSVACAADLITKCYVDLDDAGHLLSYEFDGTMITAEDGSLVPLADYMNAPAFWSFHNGSPSSQFYYPENALDVSVSAAFADEEFLPLVLFDMFGTTPEGSLASQGHYASVVISSDFSSSPVDRWNSSPHFVFEFVERSGSSNDPVSVVRCSSCNLPVPSSANLDENGKCLHCTSSNFVYRTYRLFDCLVDEKDYSASNIEYSSPEMAAILKEYCGTEYAQDAAEKIKENIKNNDDLVFGSYGMGLADKVAHSDITPISISEFGGSNTFDKEGYYLILTMDSKGGVASVASLPIFRLIGEDQLTITSKTALPTLRKEYISNGVSGSSVSAGLGDTVKVRLTGTLPDNFTSYALYEYQIEDEISHLTPIENSVSIKLNGTVDITNEFRIEPVPDIIYRFTNEHLDGVVVANTDIITIEYDAVLTSLPDATAVDPVRGFSNDAFLSYSNNPLSIGSTGTLSASAFVRSYALDLLKVDNATSAPLANVGFTVKKSVSVLDEYNAWSPSTEYEMNLAVVACDNCPMFFTSGVHLPCGFTTGKDGCPYCHSSIDKYLTRTDDGLFSFADDPYIFSTGEDGRISLEGLGAASYTIDEVLPANDYRPLAGSIGFNLNYSLVDGGFSASANCPELVSVDDSGSLITVKNMKVLSLPMTGSTGAVICTVLGVGCLIVSLVLYLRKRSERKFLE